MVEGSVPFRAFKRDSPFPGSPPHCKVRALIYNYPGELEQQNLLPQPCRGHTRVGGNNVCNYFWTISIHNSIPAQGPCEAGVRRSSAGGRPRGCRWPAFSLTASSPRSRISLASGAADACRHSAALGAQRDLEKDSGLWV